MRAIRIWKDLSIKNKQLLFFVIITVLVVAVNSYTQIKAHSYMTIFNRNLSSYFGIDNLRVSISDSHFFADNYLRTMNKEFLEKYQDTRKEIEKFFKQVEEESNTGIEAWFQINAIRYGMIAYFESIDKAVEEREREEEFYYFHFQRAARIFQYLQNYLERLIRIRFNEDRAMYDELVREASRMRRVSLSGIGVMVLLFTGFAYLVSHGITGPIRDLARASMKMAEGQLDVADIQVSSGDEVGILASSFNTMSRNIREMVDGLKQKSELERRLHDEELKNEKMVRSLKEAQFLSLQSQINPHFLFNTLNTISRVAFFEQADKSVKLIESLANVFRYNLRDGTKQISLKEELDITEEYLHIQELRFTDRLQSEIHCNVDPEVINLPIFTIQPVLENAVRHGIEPKEEGGKVSISINHWKNKVIIKVQDTGLGMSRKKLEELRSAIAAPMEDIFHSSANAGIGIANVAGRLSLYFNGQSSLEIQSKPGFGTTVTIRIPFSGNDGVKAE